MQYRQKSNGLYILSREDIEQIATEHLSAYAPRNLLHPLPLSTTDFLESYLGLIVKYRYIGDFQSGILGLTVMGDEVTIPSYDDLLNPVLLKETFGTVLLSPQLLGRENEPRRRYTEMHEASHFLLHQPYFQYRMEKAGRQGASLPYVACREIELRERYPRTDADWLEYQADHLAAALLMPRGIFTTFAGHVFRKNGIRTRCLYVGPESGRQRIHAILYEIAETFAVSYQAARIRLRQLGLMQETPDAP